MVNAVAGQTALALLTAISTADQTSTRKNPLLPNPLSLSQQGSRQRATPILQFDTPRISSDTFSVLQDTAQLSTARGTVTGDEKTRLELQLRQNFSVLETPGNPGSPGTPDTVTTTTTTSFSLSGDAIDALRQLIRSFGSGEHDHGHGYGDSYDPRLLRGLQDNLARFADTVGSASAGRDLGEVIGRLEHSVIGQGGLDFFDLFRDPRLFETLVQGLGAFERQTGSGRATAALGNLVLAVGDPSFGSANGSSQGSRRVGAAIDQLADSLAGNGRAAAAVGDFLDLLQGRHVGGDHGDHGHGNGGYAGSITGILNAALGDIRDGSLDATAVQRLQDAVVQVGNLPDIPGRRDDRLRDRAVSGLQDILDRYTLTTQNTQTTIVAGQPAVPATPGSRTVIITEQTTLVPRPEIALQVAVAYQSVQEQLKPLRKLAEQPPATPNLLYLVQLPTGPENQQRDTVLRPDSKSRDSTAQDRQGQRDQQDQGKTATDRTATAVIAALYAARQSGSLFDTRA